MLQRRGRLSIHLRGGGETELLVDGADFLVVGSFVEGRFEQMLRRFKKSVDNAGILKEVRARSYFESKSQKARRKAAKAARRRSRNKSRSGEQ